MEAAPRFEQYGSESFYFLQNQSALLDALLRDYPKAKYHLRTTDDDTKTRFDATK